MAEGEIRDSDEEPTLAPGELAVLWSVDVLGEDATADFVTELSGLPPTEARALLDRMVKSGHLVGRGILRRGHGIDGSVSVEDPHGPELQALHARAARILHEAEAPTAEVVAHLLQSDPVREPWAVAALTRAAAESRETGDQMARVAVLRRLLAERPDRDTRRSLLWDLAKAEAQVDPQASVRTYEQLLALTPDPHDRVAVRLRLARGLGNLQSYQEALDQLERAEKEAETGEDRWRACLLYVSLARVSLETRPFGRERLRRLFFEVLESEGSPVAANVFAEVAYEACLAGEPQTEILHLVRKAIGGPAMERIFDLEPGSLHVAALTLLWCGEVRDAERMAKMVLARAQRRGHAVLSAMANHWLMQVAWRRSRLADAIRFGDATLVAADPPTPFLVPATTAFKALVLAMRGDTEAAEEALRLPGGRDAWAHLAHFHGYLHAACRVALLRGDPVEAYRRAMLLGTLADSMGTLNPAILPWQSLGALALARLGDRATGRLMASEGLGRARQFGNVLAIGLALRASAANQDDPAEQLALLEEALPLYGRTPERFGRAECLQEMSEALSALGRVQEARAALATAIELAAEVEAEPLYAALSAQLEALPAAQPARTMAASEPTVHPAARQHVRVLGQFSVVDERGRDLTPTGVPGRALRVLVAAGGRLHVEELGDKLWDDLLDGNQVRQRLRDVITRLNGTEGPLVAHRGDLIELDDGVTVDAFRFDAAAEKVLSGIDGGLETGLIAVSLYSGDLLPCDPSSEWALLPRQRLRRRFLSVADRCAGLAEEAGQLDLAIDLLEKGIRQDPLAFERFERAAALYRRTGRVVLARSLEQSAVTLRSELGPGS